MYSDDDLLMLSGIQHFAFCERQWAFIHIEQQWAENVKTIEGNHLHEKVDDPFINDVRKNTITLRSVSLISRKLGLYGIADVIEFVKSDEIKGVRFENRKGYWQPLVVEYKRGKPKPDERDEVQLCAQAMCLEEMYCNPLKQDDRITASDLTISNGFLFYGETRHRHEVLFTISLREKVEQYAMRMHQLFEKGLTPPAVYKPHCKTCSLIDLCMPKTFDHPRSVSSYLKQSLDND
jgi:CRISPR-associated exonuclease Cas4